MVEITDRGKRVGLRLPVDVSGQDMAGSPFAESTESVNLSGGGLCFETQRTLGVGSRLTLDIHLPQALRKHFGGKPVYHARGVVCRVEASPSQTAFRVGVRFLADVEA
jgi:hypothetical protein